MGQPVDQRDRAGGIGKDRVPLLEGEVRRENDRLLFVAATDDLKEQVRRVRIVGEVADFIDGQDARAQIRAEPSLERAGGLLDRKSVV